VLRKGELQSPIILTPLIPSPHHHHHQQPLFLPPEVLLNHVVSFLRPRDVAQLVSTSQTLKALDPHAHVRCIRGKFRSSSLLLAHLHRCQRLATLDLRGNRLTSDGIRTLGDFLAGAAPSGSSLESLDLSALSLTSLGIRLLAQSLAGGGNDGDNSARGGGGGGGRRQLPLRTLALAVNNAGDDGAAAIGDLFAAGVLPRLEEANVSNSVITFKGLAHLARGLKGCPRLRRLNLSNNPLFEIPGALFPFGVLAASEAALAAWDAFACSLPPTIESLSIFNALLSAVAIHRLVLHWRAPALRSLNLSWNRIGADGAGALAQSLAKGACPALKSLNLSHCVVTRAALVDLTKALSAPGGIGHSIQHLNLGARCGWFVAVSVCLFVCLSRMNRSPPSTSPHSHRPTTQPPKPTGWNPLNGGASDDHGDGHQPPSGNSTDPLRALAFALARCPRLATLTLSNVELGDAGAVAIVQGFLDAAASSSTTMITTTATASCLPQLTQLNLSWNGIGPKGAAAVSGLFTSPSPFPCAPSLQSLDISYNAAGTEGLRAMAEAWSAPHPSPSARLPPGLVVHVIGNRIPRCAHHQVPASQLGTLLDEMDTAASAATAAAAAAVAAMAAFAARHIQEQGQGQGQEESSDMVVSSSPSASVVVVGGGGAGGMMDQGTQTPGQEQEQEQPQQQQQQPLPLPPILPLMAPLPVTPEHPHPRPSPQRRTGLGARSSASNGSSSSSSSSAASAATTTTHTPLTGSSSLGGGGAVAAAAAAAAAGNLRRSARVRRTATATLTAPYIPPSSSEGYYLTTRNRRRRLCTHGNSGRR
jgi:Ran GTPase-activating protein (RanGAP) involved in mRNA processing and transport